MRVMEFKDRPGLRRGGSTMMRGREVATMTA